MFFFCILTKGKVVIKALRQVKSYGIKQLSTSFQTQTSHCLFGISSGGNMHDQTGTVDCKPGSGKKRKADVRRTIKLANFACQ